MLSVHLISQAVGCSFYPLQVIFFPVRQSIHPAYYMDSARYLAFFKKKQVHLKPSASLDL